MASEKKVEITPSELKAFLRWAHYGQAKDGFSDPLINYLGALIFGSSFPAERYENGWDDVYDTEKMLRLLEINSRAFQQKALPAVCKSTIEAPEIDTNTRADERGEGDDR